MQFKYLKTAKTEHNNFVKRMINNKFTNYVSGFANASGGHIFYGIKDDGIVEGESFSDEKDVGRITTKVKRLIRTMTWPEDSSKIERGKHWDVKYILVKESDNEAKFVIVITVFPCCGGVFTEEPERYYIEHGEVKKMNFEHWRISMRGENALQLELKGSHWSSKNREKGYMKLTQRLEYFRQLGQWEKIKDIVKRLPQRKKLPVNLNWSYFFRLLLYIIASMSLKRRKNI